MILIKQASVSKNPI